MIFRDPSSSRRSVFTKHGWYLRIANAPCVCWSTEAARQVSGPLRCASGGQAGGPAGRPQAGLRVPPAGKRVSPVCPPALPWPAVTPPGKHPPRSPGPRSTRGGAPGPLRKATQAPGARTRRQPQAGKWVFPVNGLWDRTRLSEKDGTGFVIIIAAFLFFPFNKRWVGAQQI